MPPAYNAHMHIGEGLLRRKLTRLACYDYCSVGAYFITGTCAGRKSLLGSVSQGTVALSPLGSLVEEQMHKLPERWSFLTLDAHVVMPNRFHMIVWINPRECKGGQVIREYDREELRSIPQILSGFKAGVTRKARKKGLHGESPLWQRSFFDHVIRDEEGLRRIREYILCNPLKWELDRENPRHTGIDSFYFWWSEYCARLAGNLQHEN